MSNLKLPTMTYDALKSLTAKRDIAKSRAVTIAYATTAEYIETDGSTDAYVIIRHHGTVIAEVARGWVYVTNAGYDSQTTRARIHAILTDNRQDYGSLCVSQIRGDQVLAFLPTAVRVNLMDSILTRSFYSAHWDFENREAALSQNRGGFGDETVTL